MRSPRRGILVPSEGFLFYILSLVAELFLIRTVQTLYSSERMRRCNGRSSWVVQESNSCYHRLFARTRRVTEKESLSVVENNRCAVRLSRGLHLSTHKDLVFGTLVHQCQRRPIMKNQFGP